MGLPATQHEPTETYVSVVFAKGALGKVGARGRRRAGAAPLRRPTSPAAGAAGWTSTSGLPGPWPPGRAGRTWSTIRPSPRRGIARTAGGPSPPRPAHRRSVPVSCGEHLQHDLPHRIVFALVHEGRLPGMIDVLHRHAGCPIVPCCSGALQFGSIMSQPPRYVSHVSEGSRAREGARPTISRADCDAGRARRPSTPPEAPPRLTRRGRPSAAAGVPGSLPRWGDTRRARSRRCASTGTRSHRRSRRGSRPGRPRSSSP